MLRVKWSACTFLLPHEQSLKLADYKMNEKEARVVPSKQNNSQWVSTDKMANEN